MPAGALCESHMVRWRASFLSISEERETLSRLFVTAPTNHRQHPGRTWAPLLAYARQCLLVTDVYVMYQIPKLYRIALSSFAFRVRISSSVLLQSSRSR